MKIHNILLYVSAVIAVASCDFLEPETDNTRGPEVLDDPAYFCGPLNDAYSNLPSTFDLSMDAMTDNAVIRNFSGEYYKSACGGLSPASNPLDCWSSDYANIRLLNIFLNRMVLNDDHEYKTPIRFFALNNETDYANNLKMFWRLKGEAYALRAWYYLDLLRNYAGESVDGQMLGVPLVGNEVLDQSKNLNIPRATLSECIKAIVDDCDSALVVGMLPDLYTGTTDVVYNQSLSPHLSGAAAKAIKAKALLLYASPAYNKDNDNSRWVEAANAAAEAIKAAGGINTKFFTYDEYYFTKINNTSFTQNNVILKGKWVTGNRSLESDNYPSMLYGNAVLNVSQNLVDSFTDANGYPIAESPSYDPLKPFENRDARLDLFVGRDGGKIGSYVIDISGNERYNPLTCTSRSGYYLKKALNCSQVVCGPSNAVKGTPRACILIGLPELYLMYAEAANEAWGVSADPEGVGFTAKDALKRILVRNDKKGDTYMNAVIGSDRDRFREYVRIQRRIELCFEGQYYYDLRRWYAGTDDWASRLNVTVYGIEATETGYESVELETRNFRAAYPPIPYTEVFNAGLVQNKGWN